MYFPFVQYLLRHSFLHILLAFQLLPLSTPCWRPFYKLFSAPPLILDGFPFIFPCPGTSVVFAFSISLTLSSPFFSPHSIRSPVSSNVYSPSTNCLCAPGPYSTISLCRCLVPGHPWYLYFPFLQYLLCLSFLLILLDRQSLRQTIACPLTVFVPPALIRPFPRVGAPSRAIGGTCILAFFNTFFAFLFCPFY